MTTITTVKMTSEALGYLRLIAAATGEKQYAVLDRLLAFEWRAVSSMVTNGLSVAGGAIPGGSSDHASASGARGGGMHVDGMGIFQAFGSNIQTCQHGVDLRLRHCPTGSAL